MGSQCPQQGLNRWDICYNRMVLRGPPYFVDMAHTRVWGGLFAGDTDDLSTSGGEDGSGGTGRFFVVSSRTNRSCGLVPAPRYENLPPAPLPLWIPAFARMTIVVDWNNHFRTSRPSRLRPAHQGMKSLSCGLVPRLGTRDSASPHLDPSGGRAPALHFPLPAPIRGAGFGGLRVKLRESEVEGQAHQPGHP